MSGDPEAIIGPHTPSPSCPACAELFAGEPPTGCPSIRDAARMFTSVEHLRGFAALVPAPGSTTPSRPQWAEGRQS